MILSEAEARTKWCPFTFGVPEQRSADGCGIREGGPWTCCTTLCMAWQPAETAEFKRAADHDFEKFGTRLAADPTGYCAALSSKGPTK